MGTFVIPIALIVSPVLCFDLSSLPDQLIFSNESRDFSLHVSRFTCFETPYQRTKLHYCRTWLRRNEPTMLNISIHIPETLNEVSLHMKTFYKYKTYQYFPVEALIDVCAFLRNPTNNVLARHIYMVFKIVLPMYTHQCPHGNLTYAAGFWLEERFLPKSVPAGDYRMDVWFRAKDNVTLLAAQVFGAIRRKGILPSMINW
ncbi:uncharacterized protein LOC118461179 [Anopheles albimanus]|uniref:uncharacterized protein LOC118461179 n=1 Tax=Anopheles albimanus TaxID=7167 RepID=UPI001640EB50|nr:uncharacterized protein LOC118461179 [Anopheles albimanus]